MCAIFWQTLGSFAASWQSAMDLFASRCMGDPPTTRSQFSQKKPSFCPQNPGFFRSWLFLPPHGCEGDQKKASQSKFCPQSSNFPAGGFLSASPQREYLPAGDKSPAKGQCITKKPSPHPIRQTTPTYAPPRKALAHIRSPTPPQKVASTLTFPTSHATTAAAAPSHTQPHPAGPSHLI